jgi:TonB-dependent receptor
VVNPFRPDGFQGATFNKTDTYQFAIGGSWDSGPLKLSADLARTSTTFTGSTASVDFRLANRQTIDFNNGLPNGEGGGPEFNLVNFDASNPANYLFQGFYEEAQQSKGDDWQARLDAEYETGIDFLDKIQAGVRWTDHDAHREFGNRFAQFDNQAIPIGSVPLQYQLFRAGFRGTDIQDGFRTWLSPTYRSVRNNLVDLRNFVRNLPPGNFSFGGPFTAAPVAPNPTAIYDASERTLAGYAQVQYKIGETVDGVIGLRAVRTDSTVAGTSDVAGVLTPVSVSNEYTDWLPNASARIHITPQIQLRLSATRTRTKPTFAQLNPSSSVGSPIGTCTPGGDPFACARVGGGGNPFLKPFTSDNYDASLEYYFSRNGFVSAAVFRRDLEGFIQNREVRYIDPVLGPLILNGPVNTNQGRITGAEAQFSTFFDYEFLPGWAQGFGVQANVTYLDTEVDDPISPDIQERRIYGVSKWTYNIVGMYERGGLSARLSYHNRTQSIETIQNRGNDIYIETAQPAGRLDLSTSYAFNDTFTIFFDWTNILGDPFRQDFTSARDGAPRSEYTRFLRFEETIYSLGARFRF